MDASKTIRRARNDFIFAASLFTLIAGGALWAANSMDEGGALDIHGRLPQTTQMRDFANYAEKVLLVPCGALPLLGGLYYLYRRKKYDASKESAATPPTPSP